ncbi:MULTISPECIES: trypsin-like peptidase domain-containing protein [Actinomadura]|uniref:S1C family serine protease n=1 Tax=Actinomadura TaxID=1988 RepID=UPI0027DEB6EA|nr:MULTISPECIES: trypsin-like peptidase domain-containing protein [Actinomadura]
MSEIPERRGVRAAALAVLAALAALLAPACRAAEDPEVTPPVAATSTRHAAPSGRRPGVVNIDTEQGLNSTSAAGTGLVLDQSGFVLTNNHVIQGATSIKGTDTDDHRTYTARVVGYDKAGDIAVIRLDGASGLKAAVFGDASRVRVGDPVTAVGNAGGRGGNPSVVTGLVTSLGQSVTARDESDGTSERLTGLIETSAPIRPGDSGGPLLDTGGTVIGINTAAAGGAELKQKGAHRGYAIPAGRALEIARQIQRGQASETVHIGPTALLGVKVRGTGAEQGALVAEVVPGTPAETAGVPVGVTIVALGGRRVESATALTDLMLAHHPGDDVLLEWTTAQGVRQSAVLHLTDGPPQ